MFWQVSCLYGAPLLLFLKPRATPLMMMSYSAKFLRPQVPRVPPPSPSMGLSEGIWGKYEEICGNMWKIWRNICGNMWKIWINIIWDSGYERSEARCEYMRKICMKEYVGNVKKYMRNMKKYVTRSEKSEALREARCESSYIPFSVIGIIPSSREVQVVIYTFLPI